MKRLFRRLFMRPSTRAFMEEGDRRGHFSFFERLHGYVYARWTYFYISLTTGRHPWSRKASRVLAFLGDYVIGGKKQSASETKAAFADTYHGKVVPPRHARQLVTLHHDVDLGDLEHVVPYSQARDIVFKNPDHIVALECPCRAAKENPCLPMDVCLVVGEPFASFVIEHHPRKSRWIGQDEAVEILAAEHERGHVHHAFFKDAMLGRFYAICNCCSCCCAAIQGHRHGTPMLASSGFVAQIDEASCVACGTCEDVCPFDAIAVNGEAIVNWKACMGCGVCVSHCDQGAVDLVADPEKGIPLEIREIMNQAHDRLMKPEGDGSPVSAVDVDAAHHQSRAV